ncbi:hypothetical protein Pfo_005804 [Paulownia fortunei]|nr:hypothetical protein Pfo_005804 [Paulownia fortunei]
MSGGGGGGGGGGPCGACKFLRRKCVKGCVFAPYFDPDQGTAHFAAVHRVFGASNASKMLLRIPPHRRLDAVMTLCYEAVARVRDPVYGCVGHIFIGLHTSSYIYSTTSPFATPEYHHPKLQSSSELIYDSTAVQATRFDSSQSEETSSSSTELIRFCNSVDQELVEDGDLQSLALEYVSRYFPGVRLRPPSPQ